MNNKSTLTDRRGYENIVGSSPSGWNISYGIDISNGIFKPFTTNVSGVGVPHYTRNILIPTNPSGSFGATASGLNPFGNNTVYEGIVYGTGMAQDFQSTVDGTNARPFGAKFPLNGVGLGYDIFGYPSPNFSSGYDTSGVFSTVKPSGSFIGTGHVPVSHIRDVPYGFWKAGPVDLRYDQHRGVWTNGNGVYIARIIKTTCSGLTTQSTPVFSDDIRYDAMMLDFSNQMVVTGVKHVGSRPASGTYKVNALASGDYCFIVHTSVSGMPGFGIFAIEPGASIECVGGSTGSGVAGSGESPGSSGLIYGGGDFGDPASSSGLLIGSNLFDGLRDFPLEIVYGGIGLNSIGENEIIIGDSSGNFTKAAVSGGSGIAVTFSSSKDVTISLSGVAFISAGVNNNITELQGLTTPLSITQGGIGANHKNFVDLGTDQTISGFKEFTSNVRFNNGNSISPAISMSGDHYAGLYYATGFGPAFTHSGTVQAQFSSTGTLFKQRIDIYDNQTSSHIVPLRIRNNTPVSFTSTGNMIECLDSIGTLRAGITASGISFGVKQRIREASGSVTLYIDSGTLTNLEVKVPTSGTISSRAYAEDLLVWNEDFSSGANGIASGFYLQYAPVTNKLMVFKNGLLQRNGSGNDFTVANNSGIIFQTGNVPTSGSVLMATYQKQPSDNIGG